MKHLYNITCIQTDVLQLYYKTIVPLSTTRQACELSLTLSVGHVSLAYTADNTKNTQKPVLKKGHFHLAKTFLY